MTMVLVPDSNQESTAKQAPSRMAGFMSAAASRSPELSEIVSSCMALKPKATSIRATPRLG